MKIFKASLDSVAWITTISVSVVFLYCLSLLIRQWNVSGNGKYFVFLIPVIYLMAWALRPVNYRVTSSELIVYRVLNSVHISLNSIVSAEMIDSSRISWSVRTFGVGGLFGYYGRFRNADLGPMVWYATRRDQPVLIRTLQNQQIILTPDEPAQFLEAIRNNSRS